MIGRWEAPRWWGTNIYRTIAWLKAPSDEEDHVSFQLDPDPSDGVECLPEVYALEKSNVLFKLLWPRLQDAMPLRHTVLVIADRTRTRGDGKVVVGTVLVRINPNPPPEGLAAAAAARKATLEARLRQFEPRKRSRYQG